MGNDNYDVAFIGAGVSTAYTVIHLIELIGKSPGPRPLRLAVVERDEEFWTGVPYGHRAGANSLIITPLHDFLPPAERAGFAAWLDAHGERLLADFALRGGVLAKDWLVENRADLDERAWGRLFLPRYFFGGYLKERVARALTSAADAGLIRADLHRAEVVSARRDEAGYELRMRPTGSGDATIRSAAVVLAVGSPGHESPPRLPHPADPAADGGPPPGGDVLIVGSNASALEAVYTAQRREATARPAGRFYVLSPGGPPVQWTAERSGRGPYPLRHLPGLAGLPHPTARGILEAVEAECATALAEGYTIPDTIDPVSRGVVGLLDLLDPEEQREFVRTYGTRIGRLQRRAGGHYQKIVRGLLAEDRLRFVRGRFLSAAADGAGGLRVDYLDAADAPRRLPEAVAAIVDCSGVDSVLSSPSELLRNLRDDGVCAANASGRGLTVNGTFECAPGFHVLGPLLAGNLNESMRVWHAESCWRLFEYSRSLAALLAAGPVSAAS